MYKFITVKGSCNSPYNIKDAEEHCNKMVAQGYELDQCYQSNMQQCMNSNSSILVLVFKKQSN